MSRPCYCNFWVFRALKQELCNSPFESNVEVVTAVNRFFQDLPPEEFHKTKFAEWKERMLMRIANDGGYFEKDIVNCDDDADEE